jgi:hypothetical protein
MSTCTAYRRSQDYRAITSTLCLPPSPSRTPALASDLNFHVSPQYFYNFNCVITKWSFLEFYILELFCLFFETESHCVAQDGLKLTVLLPQSPECRVHRHVSTAPGFIFENLIKFLKSF